MKIAKQIFLERSMAVIGDEVLPAIQVPFKRWLFGGAVTLLQTKAMDALKALGISDGESVDIDQLEAFFTAGFQTQKTVEIPFVGVAFEKSDADKLISRLRGEGVNG